MEIGVSPAYITSRYGELFSFDDVCASIHGAAKFGFKGLQLEVFRRENMKIYSVDRIRTIRNLFDSTGLRIPQFIAHHLGPELASLKRKRKENAIKTFKQIVEISEHLGTQIIDLPSAIPPGLEFTDSLVSRPLGSPQKKVSIPPNISWRMVWKDYADTIQQCVGIIENVGMFLAIEPLPQTIISNSDAALRLMDSVASKILGVCIDTGNLLVQKEVLPVVIEKLGDRIFSTHLSDNDGCVLRKWAPGKGIMDWKAVMTAFSKIDYQGSFDLEILGEGVRSPDKEYMEGKKYLEEVLSELKG